MAAILDRLNHNVTKGYIILDFIMDIYNMHFGDDNLIHFRDIKFAVRESRIGYHGNRAQINILAHFQNVKYHFSYS